MLKPVQSPLIPREHSRAKIAINKENLWTQVTDQELNARPTQQKPHVKRPPQKVPLHSIYINKEQAAIKLRVHEIKAAIKWEETFQD